MAPIGQASSLCGFTIQLYSHTIQLHSYTAIQLYSYTAIQPGLCTALCSFTLLFNESVILVKIKALNT